MSWWALSSEIFLFCLSSLFVVKGWKININTSPILRYTYKQSIFPIFVIILKWVPLLFENMGIRLCFSCFLLFFLENMFKKEKRKHFCHTILQFLQVAISSKGEKTVKFVSTPYGHGNLCFHRNCWCRDPKINLGNLYWSPDPWFSWHGGIPGCRYPKWMSWPRKQPQTP